MATDLPVINVHTPTSSFAIIFSNTEDTLLTLFDKISKKSHAEFQGRRVRSGWVKYSWNDSIWNLDDDSDFTIFVWRHKSVASSNDIPALHVRDPQEPLPSPSQYRNSSFYMFKSPPKPARPSPSVSSQSGDRQSTHSKKSKKPKLPVDDVPKFKKEFEQFHNENGVRTVLGGIGPVNNVRMLLKHGYRHVYMSRKFALKHGFIPLDAAPGHYGYTGLVNIGSWPVTVGRTRTTHTVYLSEESHFDVVLGRSFFEKRGVKVDPVDPTDIVCMDTGEKIDCELVILKDGKGQIVTVT
ncbi:hypothetical protein QCA50_003310 [Cerrena zonata]|uniref:Uncharacterized protein n=1 Tax=Cerrena zonata TaxID=2478898 RepID=A0AAW0GTR0_9APHY